MFLDPWEPESAEKKTRSRSRSKKNRSRSLKKYATPVPAPGRKKSISYYSKFLWLKTQLFDLFCVSLSFKLVAAFTYFGPLEPEPFEEKMSDPEALEKKRGAEAVAGAA